MCSFPCMQSIDALIEMPGFDRGNIIPVKWLIYLSIYLANEIFFAQVALACLEQVDTYLGDYPRYATNQSLTGWMLLSLQKNTTASSTLSSSHLPALAVDENIRTWWSAKTGACTPVDGSSLSLFLCLDPSIEINLQYSNTSVHLPMPAGRTRPSEITRNTYIK